MTIILTINVKVSWWLQAGHMSENCIWLMAMGPFFEPGLKIRYRVSATTRDSVCCGTKRLTRTTNTKELNDLKIPKHVALTLKWRCYDMTFHSPGALLCMSWLCKQTCATIIWISDKPQLSYMATQITQPGQFPKPWFPQLMRSKSLVSMSLCNSKPTDSRATEIIHTDRAIVL